MTNKEAVQSVVGANYPLKESAYTKALIDAALNPDEDYTTANRKAVDLCAADLILALLTAADIREGGYQVTAPEEAKLKAARKALLSRYGLSGSNPVINGASTYSW